MSGNFKCLFLVGHDTKYLVNGFSDLFTDRSKVVLLLWIIHVISVVCLLSFRARLFIVALWCPAGKELSSWLSFVKSTRAVQI